jgi:hypothetical protein
VHKLGELALAAGSSKREAFVAKYPEPFLVKATGPASPPPTTRRSKAAAKFETSISGETTAVPPNVQAAAHALFADADRAFAWPVAKSGRNPFGGMITVGRTKNNDVVIEEPIVSKFHAYLARRGDAWTITDQGSTNGTTVDGKRLANAESASLQDGSRILLAPGVELDFVLPGTLYDRLTKD